MADVQRGPIVARTLHGAMTAGLVLFGAACYALRSSRPAVALPAYLGWVPLMLAAVVYPVALGLRSRLLDGGASTSAGEWWRVNLSHAVLLWSLFEGPALFGGAIYLATGGFAALGATAAGLALLVLHSPARLSDS